MEGKVRVIKSIDYEDITEEQFTMYPYVHAGSIPSASQLCDRSRRGLPSQLFNEPHYERESLKITPIVRHEADIHAENMFNHNGDITPGYRTIRQKFAMTEQVRESLGMLPDLVNDQTDQIDTQRQLLDDLRNKLEQCDDVNGHLMSEYSRSEDKRIRIENASFLTRFKWLFMGVS